MTQPTDPAETSPTLPGEDEEAHDTAPESRDRWDWGPEYDDEGGFYDAYSDEPW